MPKSPPNKVAAKPQPKAHERVNPAGRQGAPDMTYNGKPLRQS